MDTAYKTELLEGNAWSINESGFYSPDFMQASAGLGHYFLRLDKRGDIAMLLI